MPCAFSLSVKSAKSFAVDIAFLILFFISNISGPSISISKPNLSIPNWLNLACISFNVLPKPIALLPNAFIVGKRIGGNTAFIPSMSPPKLDNKSPSNKLEKLLNAPINPSNWGKASIPSAPAALSIKPSTAPPTASLTACDAWSIPAPTASRPAFTPLTTSLAPLVPVCTFSVRSDITLPALSLYPVPTWVPSGVWVFLGFWAPSSVAPAGNLLSTSGSADGDCSVLLIGSAWAWSLYGSDVINLDTIVFILGESPSLLPPVGK